ncbi:pilus assembly protein [Sphingomonas sp. IC-56]|uniref:TadE/TadG family type IV pilus assembly protein n=1 Tax=Sphingomonas sp. IC-56 TaxID=2898529 RepID=UPI001E32F3C8|nr:TadE/TadG family type IV pilus assembly protein [Sphingomonas sp. IC-56]MCD2323723.1 pilus assembly protein [Sphingomonas sp. IC-56]
MKMLRQLGRSRLGQVCRDEAGATIIEFAIVAPVLCLLLMGAFDTAHSLYLRAVLQGALQKAARDSTLERSTQAEQQELIDDVVRSQIKTLVNTADIDIKRRYYRTFAQAAAARAEDWTDENENGTCDNGEKYIDANRNDRWDRDGGNAGQGGAKDAVVYTVNVTYSHLFPLYKFIGGSQIAQVSAEAVLRNQPYGDQATYDMAQERNCP